MIEVNHLTKRYGSIKAVNDISFVINEGEVLGFLGPNGAGKTTTMNILTGYLSSNEGTVKINNIDILEDPLAVKKKIGYLPEHPPLYPEMTVKEYLLFVCELKGVKENRLSHITEICGIVKLETYLNRIIKNLSKGYRQRVGIAQSLIGNPEVLILDEPTIGLDPKEIIEIRNLIKNLGKKHTVIVSSHILPEVQAVCDRVIVLNKGSIVADDTPANLSTELSSNQNIVVRIAGPEKTVEKAIAKIEGVSNVTSLGQKEPNSFDFIVESRDNIDIRKSIFNLMAQKSWPILDFKTSELTLEDVFLHLTSESAEQDGEYEDEENIKEEETEEQTDYAETDDGEISKEEDK